MRRTLTVWLLLHLVSVPHPLARPAITGHVVTTVGDVGAHYPLFRIEKSHHPEHLIVVYTKLDPHCRVLPDPAHGGLPTLDFYWLMDATRYKPMAALLKAGIRQRLQFTDTQGPPEAPTAFAVRLDALARLTHDLRRPTVQITTARHGEACLATASLTLGPSHSSTTLKLEAIVTKTEAFTLPKQLRAMVAPDALQVYAVTVQGTDLATGQLIERTYTAAE
jgi:hypothetical protein